MYSKMEPRLGHGWWQFSSLELQSRCPTCWTRPAQAGELCLGFPGIAPERESCCGLPQSWLRARMDQTQITP